MNYLIAAGGVVDPATSSIVNLIGGLGSAGAAVAVVWMFLWFLRGFLTQMYASFEALAERQGSIIKDNSDAFRDFNKSVNTICRAELAMRKTPHE